MDRSEIILQVVVLGFGVTLIALVALYLILNLFGRLFTVQKKNTPELKPPAAKPSIQVETGPSKPDGRLVAAITGAISAFLLDKPYKIRITPSLETGLTANAWLLTGRKNLMTGALKLAALRRRNNREEI